MNLNYRVCRNALIAVVILSSAGFYAIWDEYRYWGRDWDYDPRGLIAFGALLVVSDVALLLATLLAKRRSRCVGLKSPDEDKTITQR